ncbi:MAG: adenylate/guanylate cyclase domain-containing protein [Corynebacterium sp.]|nr:adenylate/guanylate cyclase domain-containing protein [Corynebacterium sp.]
MSRLKWLLRTSWPLYTASVLASNVVGAIAIVLFVSMMVPLPELSQLNETMGYLPAVVAAYLVFATIVGAIVTFMLFQPVLRWQRNPAAHDPNMVRNLVMRLPMYQALLCTLVWVVGLGIVAGVAATISTRLALVIGLATALGGAVVVMFTYLEAQRLVRPVAATALARGIDNSSLEPPIEHRLRLTWLLTTGAPVIGIMLMIAGQEANFFTSDATDILPAIIALGCTALLSGYVATALATASVTDPIRELHEAINQVRRGEQDTAVQIYDGSEIGILQAGFNEMMRGLREQQRVRDLFGRYVGAEVARRAMEERPTLGGEDRKVAVLFVDVIGSTTFAVNHSPEEVVAELNKFFEHVVGVVHRHKGIINKFQGDAALAIFGAPLPLADAAGNALAAARELHQELKGLELTCGIGVASGHVVAGHIGGHARFEYTVIGDAVNQAARLTELAKETPGQVLTSAATLRDANEAEKARWTILKSVELRGRKQMTQLARPVRPTLADRS